MYKPRHDGMTRCPAAVRDRPAGLLRRAAWAGLALLMVESILLCVVRDARARSYPMYQCSPGHATVAPGWSAYSFGTVASAVLTNTCATSGMIGDYVFSNGQPGAVTENGSMGSQIGLQLMAPADRPDISIESIAARVGVSPVSGDDAWLGFSSSNQGLPGGVELPYGGTSDYTAKEDWSPPQGARDFEMYVNCSTDRSNPTCDFTNATHVPALNDLVLTLTESVPPTIANVSGSLVASAAAGGPVSGTQTLQFDASDADSGVRSAALTLTPQAGGAPQTTTVDYGTQCSYSSWNACPLSEKGSTISLNTAALPQGVYAVSLKAADAAGNTSSVYLGKVVTRNTPHLPNGSPACTTATLTMLANGKPRSRPMRFGRRVQISGLLRCEDTPISDAEIQIAGAGLPVSLSTDANGRFRYTLRAGPTRTLDATYRAYSDDRTPAAHARLKLEAYPVIALQITPRQTHNGGTIIWRGRVIGGPLPPGGLTLLVEVKIGGRWETFDQLATANGRFAYRYAFQRTTQTTTYTFRVAIPSSGAAGYAYLPSASRSIRVRVLGG